MGIARQSKMLQTLVRKRAADADELIQERAKLEGQVQEKNKVISLLRSQLASTKSSLANLSTRCCEQQLSIGDLSRRLHDQEDSRREWEERTLKRGEDLSNALHENEHLKTEVEGLRAQTHKAKAEMTRLRLDRDEARKELHVATMEASSARSQAALASKAEQSGKRAM